MGALTSKPFSFAARSWELLDRLAFDCTDTFFSSVKVSFRGKTVMRVLPDFSAGLLSEWISDRVRFSYDSLQNQSEHDFIYQFQLSKLSQSFLHFFFKRFCTISNFFDFVSAYQSKSIVSFSGFAPQTSTKFSYLNFDIRNSYSFNFSLFQKDSFKNYFFFGLNFRYQLPVFAVLLRKLSTSAENFFFNFGFFTNNLLGDVNFGSSIKVFHSTIRGKSKISRVYNSRNSVAFSNPYIYPLLSRDNNVTPLYAFFDDPKNFIFAEVFSIPFILTSPISIYLPHFFLSNQVFPRNGKLQRFDSPVISQENSYKFHFFNKNFSLFHIFYPNKFTFDSSLFMYDNYYSHYSISTSSNSSLNILLALKRQTNSRSNFIYYS